MLPLKTRWGYSQFVGVFNIVGKPLSAESPMFLEIVKMQTEKTKKG